MKISQPVLKVAVSKIRRRNAAHTTLQVQAIRVDQEEEDMLEAAPRRFKFTSGPSPTTRRIARPHPRGRERKKAAKILILRHRDGVQGAAGGAIHTEANPCPWKGEGGWENKEEGREVARVGGRC